MMKMGGGRCEVRMWQPPFVSKELRTDPRDVSGISALTIKSRLCKVLRATPPLPISFQTRGGNDSSAQPIFILETHALYTCMLANVTRLILR